MGYNKVTYGDKVLIDLSQDTVIPRRMVKGYTAHAADGSIIEGQYNLPSFTVDPETQILTIVYDNEEDNSIEVL